MLCILSKHSTYLLLLEISISEKLFASVQKLLPISWQSKFFRGKAQYWSKKHTSPGLFFLLIFIILMEILQILHLRGNKDCEPSVMCICWMFRDLPNYDLLILSSRTCKGQSFTNIDLYLSLLCVYIPFSLIKGWDADKEPSMT